MTAQKILAAPDAAHLEARGLVAQMNAASERDGLQMHAGAVKRELGA